MAGLDAESIANHDEVSNQFAFPSRNNPFSVLIPMLEQVEVEWESTYTSEDQELAPVNRRIVGSEILYMILRVLSFSASKTLGGTGYHLQLYGYISSLSFNTDGRSMRLQSQQVIYTLLPYGRCSLPVEGSCIWCIRP